MAGLSSVPTTAPRNRLLVWLLLGTLGLSVALNLYLLLQAPDFPVDSDLDIPFMETAAEVELQRTRQALAECQSGRDLVASDSLATAAATSSP